MGALDVSNRLRRNLRRLKPWLKRSGTTCYRAYDADIPEYSAAIDVYTDLRGQRWLHLQEYAAPRNIPEDTAARRFEELYEAACEVFEVPEVRVASKVRRRGHGGSRYGTMDRREQFITVEEGQAQLLVNLFDRLDTGLFLDHRPVRLRIFREAAGKRFLNLFCYTGAATCQAICGGARSTDSVDLSGTYLAWAQRNFEMNGASQDHQTHRADTIQWLREGNQKFDLIFCDPPVFSNSSRLTTTFDVQRDHVELIKAASARLAEGGLLLFSNNARRFRLDHTALAESVEVTDITESTLDPDFQRRTIHRCWEIVQRT